MLLAIFMEPCLSREIRDANLGLNNTTQGSKSRWQMFVYNPLKSYFSRNILGGFIREEKQELFNVSIEASSRS